MFWDSLVAQSVKNLPANAGHVDSVPGLGRSLGEGNGNPLWYSCLENPCVQRSLLGYSQWGCKESDTTEQAPMQTYCVLFFNYLGCARSEFQLAGSSLWHADFLIACRI